MKHLSLFLFYFCISWSLSAQESESSNRLNLKFYNTFQYEKFEAVPFYQHNGTFEKYQTKENYTWLKPSVAIQWQGKKDKLHEIEWVNFIWNQKQEYFTDGNHDWPTWVPPSYQYKSNLINIAFRYEYLLPLFSLNQKNLNFSIGLGGSPFFIRDKISPIIRNLFPITVTEAGINFYAIPRINYQLSKKFFLDFNILINLAQSEFQRVKMENPSRPVAEQINNRWNFNLLPNVLAARVGVGIKL